MQVWTQLSFPLKVNEIWKMFHFQSQIPFHTNQVQRVNLFQKICKYIFSNKLNLRLHESDKLFRLSKFPSVNYRQVRSVGGSPGSCLIHLVTPVTNGKVATLDDKLRSISSWYCSLPEPANKKGLALWSQMNVPLINYLQLCVPGASLGLPFFKKQFCSVKKVKRTWFFY